MPKFADVKSFNIPTNCHDSVKQNVTTSLKMSSGYGFLPEGDPLLTLNGDDRFNKFISFAESLPNLVKDKKVCETLDAMNLPDFSPKDYPYKALVRVYAAGTSLIHAYILESGGNRNTNTNPVTLPKKLSAWFEKISHQIGRLPTQTYETYVLQNYRLINKNEGYTLDNIDPLITYAGSDAEKWFIKMHVYAEHHVAAAMHAVEKINLLLKNKQSIDSSETQNQLIQCFNEISKAMSILNQSYFAEMERGLEKGYFFEILRPFLQNWDPGVIYQDSSVYKERTISWRGASGAESSFIPAIDLIAQLKIDQEDTMRDMENYMPPEHQAFLNAIRNPQLDLADSIKAAGNNQLIESYNQVAEASYVFRRKHYNLFVVPYIVDNLVKVFTKMTIESLSKEDRDYPNITNMVPHLLKQFFTCYKKLMCEKGMEYLLEAHSRPELDNMMARLKRKLGSVNSGSTSSSNRKVVDFEEALLASFKKIIQDVSTEFLPKSESDKNNTAQLFSIVEKTFDQFVVLSSSALGTGREDFSVFLQKNINAAKRSQLSAEHPSFCSSLVSAIRARPVASTLLATTGLFAAGAMLYYQQHNNAQPSPGFSSH